MISYQMENSEKPDDRGQLNATVKPQTKERVKTLAAEFGIKPSTAAGEIIELGHEAWARHKRMYEGWMKSQIESSIIAPPHGLTESGTLVAAKAKPKRTTPRARAVQDGRTEGTKGKK